MTMPGRWARLRTTLGRHETFVHIAQLMTGTAAAQVLIIALTPILSRLYTVRDYGAFAVYSAAVGLVGAVATLRYDMAIMLPEQDRHARVLRSVVTWVSFVIGAATTVVLVFVAPWLARVTNAPDSSGWLLLVGLSIFTLAEISALTYWLNRKSRYKAISSNRILQSGSGSLVQILFGATTKLGVGGLVLGSLAGQLVGLIALRVKTPDLREGPAVTGSERRAMMRRYHRMPLFNAPTALIDAFRLNGMNFVIGAYSATALGHFAMAWRMVEMPAVLVSGALAQVFFQKLSVVGRGELFAAAKASVLRSAAFGIVPFLAIYLLAPWIFPFVFGAQWAESGYYARSLVPWLLMNLITSPISTLFVITEKQHISLIFAVVYAAVPPVVIVALHQDMSAAIFVMGLAMAAMLVIYTVLALVTARRYDREPTGSAGAEG